MYHPAMKCIRINVSMPDKTRQRLAVLAGDDHISMSEVIRRLVDAAWRDRRAPEPSKGDVTMNEAIFKVGDVVTMRTGGPLMTVNGIGHRGEQVTVGCVWFVGAELSRDAFSMDALRLATEAELAAIPA